ncbi:MAG: prepilin-type N-terminal cleavage/methylation domain-containing protein [Candidatus Eremiobacteraeota bacterium]|nr:prepilin-type N-terminal cleavage/methylation domain-containing protein [Candidatus Eremiobacteraeota bacterium]
MRRQQGFTLAEVLVATAIAFVLGWLLLRLDANASGAASRAGARAGAAGSAGRLAERLESDATSAWSVFVPDTDVQGAANADGHELDFANEDASHDRRWWAYDFDATTQTVTSYAYVPDGAPTAGERFPSVASFSARGFAISAIGDPASPIYDPLFAGASAVPVDFHFGWNARALGGNHVVRVTFDGDGSANDLLLSSATAPTHFTVVVQYTPPP